MVSAVFHDRRLTRNRALVMAVIDAAPSDPVQREVIRRAVDEGADLIGIGALDASGLPLVEWARKTYPDLAISVRTERPDLAEQANLAGADLLDDGWGSADSGVLDAAVRHGSGYICAATPDQVGRVSASGIPRTGVLVRVAPDPTSLAQLPELVHDGWLVLVDDDANTTPGILPEDRLAGALAVTALAARAGAVVIRTRHVRATRHAVEMVASILCTRPPSRPQRWLV